MIKVQNPVPAQWLTSELATQGKVPLQLDGTVVPVVELPGLYRPRYSARASVAAGGAGNRSIMAIIMDGQLGEGQQGVNNLVVLEEVWVSMAAPGTGVIIFPTGGITGLAQVTARAMDRRFGESQHATCWSRNGAAVPAGNIVQAWEATTIDSVRIPLNIVLPPFAAGGVQHQVVVCAAADNQALDCTMVFSEPGVERIGP